MAIIIINNNNNINNNKKGPLALVEWNTKHMWLGILIQFSCIFQVFKPLTFFIGIHSIKGWTATKRHRVMRKRSTQRLKHIGDLFGKNNLQTKVVC